MCFKPVLQPPQDGVPNKFSSDIFKIRKTENFTRLAIRRCATFAAEIVRRRYHGVEDGKSG
jgi:hypothetical protein